MASVFYRKEMPYLFLLLVAVLGFFVVKIYDRASALKILECTVSRQGNIENYFFKNLSKSSKVEKVKVFFVDINSTISDMSVQYVPPAIEPDAPEPPKRVSPSRWYLDLGDLGPSDSVHVTVVFAGFRGQPLIRFSSASEVLFLYRNFLTCFYGNEFYVLLGLVGLALLLTILYTFLLALQRDEVKK